jgi:hypothetical protein
MGSACPRTKYGLSYWLLHFSLSLSLSLSRSLSLVCVRARARSRTLFLPSRALSFSISPSRALSRRSMADTGGKVGSRSRGPRQEGWRSGIILSHPHLRYSYSLFLPVTLHVALSVALSLSLPRSRWWVSVFDTQTFIKRYVVTTQGSSFIIMTKRDLLVSKET